MSKKINVVREVLWRDKNIKESARQCAKHVDVSDKTVSRIRKKARKNNVTYDDIKDMSDDELKAIFYSSRQPFRNKRVPDCAGINKRMSKKGWTLALDHYQYRRVDPDTAYSYSSYCDIYKRFMKKTEVTMRQNHYAGETIMVDFAGTTIPYYDIECKESKKAQIFVAILGCSKKTYVVAVSSQNIRDWIWANTKMLEFFEGIPEAIIVDNLKAAVIKAGQFANINKVFKEWARYYNVSIAPTRVRRPKDKALVENAVLHVTRWIIAVLRDRQFFSVEEINEAIPELLEAYNNKAFKRIPGSRQSRYEELDKPLLRPLPQVPFEQCEWIAKQKVGPDYHVYVLGHAYSVPYHLVSEYVEARVTSKAVEFFHKNLRVALHVRNDKKDSHSTLPMHRPMSHQQYAEQNLQNYMEWAATIGNYACDAVLYQFKDKKDHSFVSSKACSQLKKLAKIFGEERFEAACERAKTINSLTVKSIRSILQNKLDMQEIDNSNTNNFPLHSNVRGSDYYQGGSSHAI